VNDSSTILQRGNEPALVPRLATLDGFVNDTAESRGIDLRQLDPLTNISVRTHNSCYRLVITSGTSAIVQGGQFFPDPTPARIDGSGFGGTMLKVAWIGVGLRMEIFANDQRIITSPVRRIGIERQSAHSVLH
jgi:hypothetical protein